MVKYIENNSKPILNKVEFLDTFTSFEIQGLNNGLKNLEINLDCFTIHTFLSSNQISKLTKHLITLCTKLPGIENYTDYFTINY